MFRGGQNGGGFAATADGIDYYVVAVEQKMDGGLLFITGWTQRWRVFVMEKDGLQQIGIGIHCLRCISPTRLYGFSRTLRTGNEGFVVLEGAQETQLAEGVFTGGTFGKDASGAGSLGFSRDFFGNAITVFSANFTHSVWHNLGLVYITRRFFWFVP